MKAVVIRKYGGPEVLEYADFPDPKIGAGEALVRVAAASINPIDIMERSGLTKDFKPIQFPGVLGWDLSGTVVEAAPGVDGAAPGDKVLAWAYHTYAELCSVKVELLAKVPDGLDLIEAAALPVVTTTGAELISVAAGIKTGQSVLVSGAFGGVGRSAVFAAKERGAKVIAGVLTKQLTAAADLGADEIVALDDEAAMKSLPPMDAVANAVREQSRRFHALPLEEKLKLKLDRDFRGYIPINTSTIVTSSVAKVSRPNQSESLMIMHEVAPDDPATFEGPPLQGPNQWPPEHLVPGFRRAMERYVSEMTRLAHTVVRANGSRPLRYRPHSS